MRFAILSIFAVSILGCGQSNFQVNHDLPGITPSPIKQLSQGCVQANSQVGEVLTNLRTLSNDATIMKTVLTNHGMVMPDGSCAVMVQLQDHSQVVPLIAAMKASTGGLDSYVQIDSGALIPIWFDEVHHPANASQGKAGSTFDNSVTPADCQQAAQVVQTAQPAATVKVANNAGASAVFQANCYVQVQFATDAAYETFLQSTPTWSQEQELFHVDILGSDNKTVLATVWLRAFSLQQQPP